MTVDPHSTSIGLKEFLRIFPDTGLRSVLPGLPSVVQEAINYIERTAPPRASLGDTPEGPYPIGESMVSTIADTLRLGATLKVRMSPTAEPVLIRNITFVGNEEIVLSP
jgi:hypothetical protein